MELSKVSGRQFLRLLLNFPCFGMHIIIPSKAVVDITPRSIFSIRYLKIQCLSSSKNFLKNLFENPSGPGALVDLFDLIACSSSSIV